MKFSTTLLLTLCTLASAAVLPNNLGARQETPDAAVYLDEAEPVIDDSAILDALATVDIALADPKEPAEGKAGDHDKDNGKPGVGKERKASDIVDKVARDLGLKTMNGAVVHRVAVGLRRQGL